MIRIWLTVAITAVSMSFVAYNSLKISKMFLGGVCIVGLVWHQIYQGYIDTGTTSPDQVGRRWIWMLVFWVVVNLIVYTIAWFRGSPKPDTTNLFRWP